MAADRIQQELELVIKHINDALKFVMIADDGGVVAVAPEDSATTLADLATKLGFDLQALQFTNPGLSSKGVLESEDGVILPTRSQALASQGLHRTGSETAAEGAALARRFKAHTRLIDSLLKSQHVTAEQDLSGWRETALSPGQVFPLSPGDHVIVGTNGAGETVVLSAPAGVLTRNAFVDSHGGVSNDPNVAAITATGQGYSLTDRAGRVRQLADAGGTRAMDAHVAAMAHDDRATALSPTTVEWRTDGSNLFPMPLSGTALERLLPLAAVDYAFSPAGDIDWSDLVPPPPLQEEAEAVHPTIRLMVDDRWHGPVTIGYVRFRDAQGNLSPLPDAPDGAYDRLVDVTHYSRNV